MEAPGPVVVRGHGSGTHTGVFLGIAATGQTMSYEGLTSWPMAGDLISEAWVAANLDEMVASMMAEP